MNNTALGAKKVLFIGEVHENFYNEKLNMVRYKDVYHKPLIYCLGINAETRSNVTYYENYREGIIANTIEHVVIQICREKGI